MESFELISVFVPLDKLNELHEELVSKEKRGAAFTEVCEDCTRCAVTYTLCICIMHTPYMGVKQH